MWFNQKYLKIEEERQVQRVKNIIVSCNDKFFSAEINQEPAMSVIASSVQVDFIAMMKELQILLWNLVHRDSSVGKAQIPPSFALLVST